MPVFACSQCGKCCMNFGELIRVERELGDTDFYCRFLITNEVFRAHVMPEWREAFADTAEVDAHPAWCRFLRRSPDGSGFVCTVHDSNASICREFRCCLMRIYDGTGKQLGKVGGNRSLISDDEELLGFFRGNVRDIGASSLKEWLQKAGKALAGAGYRVVVYDEE
ncbi:MAG TPA: YkgJ family cysteine cluster protein [Methanomicrobiales archaeon]|nr:YkgJ family cysteine cluster protein [Methanomicrobiales archaeon]